MRSPANRLSTVAHLHPKYGLKINNKEAVKIIALTGVSALLFRG